MDTQDSALDPLAPLAEEFVARYRRGEGPGVSDYIERYPELAERIRSLFPALLLIEDLGSAEAPGRERSDPLEGHRGGMPRQLGDYRILREVGRGGMGVVFEAEQMSLGRRVALKILPGSVTQDGSGLERFRREARSAARLHHTNIVPVFEIGQEGQTLFYAMQFIQGQGLDQVVRELRRLRASAPRDGVAAAETASQGPSARGELERIARSLLTGRFGAAGPEQTPATGDPGASGGAPPTATAGPTPTTYQVAGSSDTPPATPAESRLSEADVGRQGYYRDVARIGQQVCGALGYAHSRGVVHRDIKPANLLLDAQGIVWVADFGLAKSDDEGLTASGDLLGTLRYMAPERFRGECDGRVDIYALGLTLYELLTLQPAFEESDRLRLIEAIKQKEPPRPRSLDARIPRDLETIVLTAIDRDPRRRYQDAGAMAEDLRRFVDGEPIRARPVPAWRRAALWAQRRPAEAALAGVGVVAALATVGMAVSLWYGDQLRQSLYLQQIATAGLAWRDANFGRLEQLLDACPEKYRGLWEWRLLKRECHPERLLLSGHSGGVYRLAYSRDGSRLATASLDGLIRLWDPATGRLLARLASHTRDVLGVSFSPDDRQLVSADADGTIYLWDVETGRPIRVFTSPGTPTMCTDVKFSPDGARFATAESRGVVRIWDVTTGASETLPGDALGQGEINAVAFAPGGRVLAIGGVDRPILLWDLVHRRMLPSLGEPGAHTEATLGLAFSPGEGRLLASAGTNGTVALWDVASGKVRYLTGHVGDVYGVAFSPDGRRLATASGDPCVKIWDVESGRELGTLTGHAATVFDVAFSPKGDRLATASQDRTARIWDPDIDPTARVLRGHVGPVNAVAFQPRGGLLASGGEDGAVKLWGADDRTPVTLPGHDAPVTSLCFSPGGELLAAGDRRGGVRVWDIMSGRPAGPPLHAGGEVTSLAFYPDGRLATAGVDGLVRTWDIRTGVPGPSYRAHERSVRGLAISPDGAYLATSGEDRTVVLRDAASGRAIRDPLRGHSCWVYAVAFAPESRSLSSAGGPAPGASLSDRLASVSGDGELIIWDVQGRQPPRAIRAHGNFVRALAFHPDGSRLASGGMDRTVKLWDATTGDEVLSLRAHAPVLGVAFSPDGDRLAAACNDGTVRIWDAKR